MAAATVSTAASLTLPRRADHARGPSLLRRRHCAVVRPLAASSNPAPSGDAAECSPSPRRQVLVAGAAAAAAALVSRPVPAAFAEGTKGFLGVIDRKAGYSFVYPFGWQEVSVQGQDKVYKDVIEPLESVSINMIPTTKEDIRDLGPPDQVAEALVRKVLAPPTQKTKLIEAKQAVLIYGLQRRCYMRAPIVYIWPNLLSEASLHLVPTEIDGRAYYTFEFTAQAPNFTRHALGTITIANGKFYTLATGANERRWDKMKERLHTIVDSFKIETKV